ncbi:glycine zipper 2TM domain-containing protein [Pseudoduganella sp. LjRoot289]|uniref:glycine zipper 2TM domain-containing protein n=1 Tax=Pseudoduganella sp. LjRoot289 TaxID=3342314 RepID=UPI003ECECA31
MNMPSKLILSALCLGALPLAQATEFEDYGRVVQVKPQIEQINRPRQECRTEYVQVQQPAQRSAGGSIVGGIAGALLGSQIGGGHGKTAATAAGAIAGAVVGDRVDNQNVQPGGVTEQAVKQCRTVDSWESRTNGYEVTYDYRGRNYTSIMSFDPGQRVRLRVSVEPMQN